MSPKETSEKTPTPSHRATTPSHREARAEALQRALRDNLRRRKAAATEAKDAPPSPDETTRKNDG
jgi:hypothetical protein